ncbi:WD40 repeat-like protein [Panus rudis PR-1116 ss-1]|nr:WD40 repeat-like protein [Panus rudis PR-1116 ss-1]
MSFPIECGVKEAQTTRSPVPASFPSKVNDLSESALGKKHYSRLGPTRLVHVARVAWDSKSSLQGATYDLDQNTGTNCKVFTRGSFANCTVNGVIQFNCKETLGCKDGAHDECLASIGRSSPRASVASEDSSNTVKDQDDGQIGWGDYDDVSEDERMDKDRLGADVAQPDPDASIHFPQLLLLGSVPADGEGVVLSLKGHTPGRGVWTLDWNTRTGELLTSLKGHENLIWKAEFSHDGSRVVTGSDDNSTRVWDATTGDQLVIIRKHTGPVWSVGFSPDSRSELSCRGNVIVWDVSLPEGKLEAEAECVDLPVSGALRQLGRPGDGGRRKLMKELKGHTDKVRNVLVTDDQKRMVSSSDNGSVRS